MRLVPWALVLAACAKTPVGDTCEAGRFRCDRNQYQQCADDGNSWQLTADCAASAQICVLNIGCRVCSPQSLTCGGDGFDIVLCRDDGSGYDSVGRCEPENGDVCAGGRCRNACDLAAENRSYEGCDYWAVDLDNAVVANQGAAAAQQYAVVVSNPLEVPADVVVEVNDAPPGQPAQVRQVAHTFLERIPGSGDLHIFNLDSREVDGSSDPHLNDGPGTWLSSNAYHIRSTAPIIAYQFNPLDNVNVFSNDASLLLPTRSLDREYAVLAWPETFAITDQAATNGGIFLRTFLTIVGTDLATHVQVTLSTATVNGGSSGIPDGQPGQTLAFQIGPFDVVNLEAGSFLADFTGSIVRADRPVAVFAGSEASDVPYFTTFADRFCCADHMEEQLFPTSALGQQFVATKTPLRTKYVEEAGWDVALVPDEPEWWRILAIRDGTLVRTNLPPPSNQFMLNAGQVATFSTTRDFTVDSSLPVSFGQFPASQQTTGIPSTIDGQRVPGGDPSFILVPPIEQWRSKYVFLIPDKYAFDFLLMSLPTTSNLLFDGDDLMTAMPDCEFKSAGTLRLAGGSTDTEFVSIRCPLSHPHPDNPNDPRYQNDGRHVLESRDGQTFGLVIRGWDSFVGYGYPGGADVHQINVEN